MKRRDFLRIAGLGTAAAMFPATRSAFAWQDAPAATRSLVTIYLRGGMDAINAIIPYGDKHYFDIRPTIAIPRKDGEEGPGCLPLDETFGFHPSLASLKPLYESKKLAAIISAGSPHRTRSHFDAQDFMEYAAPGMRTVRNGWLNRYLQATQKKGGSEIRGLAMQGVLPRSLRGTFPVLAVPNKKVIQDKGVLDMFEKVYRDDSDDPVVSSGRETVETLRRYKKLVETGRGESKVTYPGGKLGSKLRDIASVLKADAGLEVACADYGGWDHHANEGGNEGTISDMLRHLADSLAAFVEDLGDRMDSTLVFVITEFGRTCRENGNGGTDHGHGGSMFLLGGGVQGGKIHGDWRGLEKKALYQGRDLPVTTDFREVFAQILKSHMGFEPPKGFFPDYKAQGVRGLFGSWH